MVGEAYTPPPFSPLGPFDAAEQRLVHDLLVALSSAAKPTGPALAKAVFESVERLDRLGELLHSYPSILGEQSLGGNERNLASFLQRLSRISEANFEMFLPTRALLSRVVVMAEMNFYRLLRHVSADGLDEPQRESLDPQIEQQLCHCIYTRITEELLMHIAADHNLDAAVREHAVLALAQQWEVTAYRLGDHFHVLEATWEARRQVATTLGTLLGTAEMFRLLQAGCDERFVDYLVRPDHSDDEAAAFREFLFGITTEDLEQLEARMQSEQRTVVGLTDLDDVARSRVGALGRRATAAAPTRSGDPALAMFEFFRARQLQAAAREQAELPGPKRTAEEHVLIHFLSKQ